MRRSTPGTARPTVSSFAPSSELHVSTGTSLVPYAVIQLIPTRSVTASATLWVTGVAHHMMYRSDDRS